MKTQTLSPELLHKMNAYWRAANYLSVGQIYLYDNPLLKEPLKLSHVKPLVVGHWGTTPGQNFIYVHLNRIITFHKVRRPTAATEKLFQFLVLDAGEDGWVADLVAIEMQDRQNGPVGYGIDKLGGLP